MDQLLEFRFINIFEDVNVISQDRDPKIILTHPVLNFIVPFIPTQLSFSVVAGVSGFMNNLEYKLEIQILNEKTNEILIKLPWFIHPEEEELIDGVTPAAIFATNIKNLIVENEGRFNLQIVYEEEVLGSCFFEVFMKSREE